MVQPNCLLNDQIMKTLYNTSANAKFFYDLQKVENRNIYKFRKRWRNFLHLKLDR